MKSSHWPARSRHSVVALTVLAATSAFAGCGSGGDDADPDPAADSADPPDPTRTGRTYFSRDDSDRINQALESASEAVAAASGTGATACNEVGDFEGFGPWRNCLHDLLDPVTRAIADITGALHRSARAELGPDCNGELDETIAFYEDHLVEVDGLLEGFDSTDSAAQTRSARAYGPVLEDLRDNLGAPLGGLTEACYSPDDLRSLGASPSRSS